jgi:hypothetical protein
MLMGLATDVRRNAPFIGVLFAIGVTTLALVVAVVALLTRMHG